VQDGDRESVAHWSLLARRRRGPPWASRAGTPGGCHKPTGWGKSDASRGHDSGRGRPAGDRGDRAGLPGSAGAAGPRRADCGRGRPADTGGHSRRGPDRRRDTGRRAADTSGRPASGGSPRPRGPGDVRGGLDKRGRVCDTYGRSVHAPRGVERPGGLELAPPGSHPFTSGVAAPYPKTSSPSTLCPAVVRISTLFGERQHAAPTRPQTARPDTGRGHAG